MTDRLRDAFDALRERHDGTHPESDATLRRALLRTRKRQRERSVVRWFVLPAAAVMVASTAWAGATGRLSGAVEAINDVLHIRSSSGEMGPSTGGTGQRVLPTTSPTNTAEHVPEPEATTAPSAPATVTTPEAAPTTMPTIAAVPAPSPVMATERHEVAKASPTAAVIPSTTASSIDPTMTAPAKSANAPEDPNAALFAEAHRLHFVARDSAKALAAWDAYLSAAPNGRFVPEARYNRAITLVRLGRTAEAKQELRAFADGTYGDYRRDEARALLDALAHDE